MHKITEVQVLENYRLRLTFADGTRGTADLSDLVGKGVFVLWNDYDEFRKVKIGSMGELAWGDQVDLCPDSLYLRVTGKTPEEIFPASKESQTDWARLRAMGDADIDFSDCPEITPEMLTQAVVRKGLRPVRRQAQRHPSTSGEDSPGLTYP